MIGRIVDIADDHRHLARDRGFLVVSRRSEELGRVALDDIAALIVHAHGVTYTNNLLVELARRNAPFVLCDETHSPVGMLWPVDGHHQQAGRMDAQLDAGRPLRKRLWAQLVRAKLMQQAVVLAEAGLPHAPLSALVARVRSGDPSNVEAQGARRYWTLLMGAEFRRDRSAPGANALLNYGYTVLRAAVARAIIGAGLHPGIPLHHANQGNPMRLADDLMEPYRPFVDRRVRELLGAGLETVDATTKRELAHLLYQDIDDEGSTRPLYLCIERTATSLAQVFLGERETLLLPPAPQLPCSPVTA